MSDSFDFAAATAKEADAYHPPTHDVLPAGNYIVKLAEIENTTSSGGYPMLRIKVENDQGVQWDNLVISPHEFSVAKLLGLIDAAGLERPDATKGEIDATSGKLDDGFVYRLEGKTVGVIVRDEEDNREEYAGQVRPRVKGYVSQSVLSDANTGPLGGTTTTSTPSPSLSNGGASSAPLAF
jgi:hypothetical protein